MDDEIAIVPNESNKQKVNKYISIFRVITLSSLCVSLCKHLSFSFSLLLPFRYQISVLVCFLVYPCFSFLISSIIIHFDTNTKMCHTPHHTSSLSYIKFLKMFYGIGMGAKNVL